MKYCEYINNSITFMINKIIPCCTPFAYNAPKYAYYPLNKIYDGQREGRGNIDFSNMKKEMIEKINNKQLYDLSCFQCCHLKDNKNDICKEEKYNQIILKHWTTCNCNCIYCDNLRDGQKPIAPLYNPCNIIESLYEKDLIDKDNLVVKFQGGDIGVLKDFNKLVELFEKNGFKRIDFSTNNIIYQPAIERILSEGKASLNASLDCGNKETYKKIKQIDSFDNFIKNLKLYIKKSKNKESININFIIINGINDNKKEIRQFIKLMHKIGVTTIGLRLDHKFINQCLEIDFSEKNYTKNLTDLVLYFFKTAKRYKLCLSMEYEEQNLVLKKMFKQNKHKKLSLRNKFKKLFLKLIRKSNNEV